MGLITIHVHGDFDGLEKKLDRILLNQRNQMAAIDTIKEQLALSDEKITILTTATEGVKQDVAFIKAKLEASPGGIDAAGVTELLDLVTAQNTKLTEAATALSDLDAETDSTVPTP